MVPRGMAGARLSLGTEDGYPYCGDPQCDIDYCNDCEGELPEIPLRSAQGLVGSEYRS